MGFVRWLHLVSAAVWLGGLITLGGITPALRKADVSRDQLRAMAKRFGDLAWIAMAVAVATGVIQVWSVRTALTTGAYAGKIVLKVTLVALAAGMAYWHQTTARQSSPVTRGAVEASILVVSLAIFAAAVAL